MTESIESIVTGLVILIAAVIIVASHRQRARRRERWLDGHRLWDKVRHRH